MSAVQVKIKQRTDMLSNWLSNDTKLEYGELAIVIDGDYTKFKIGDGVRKFSQLKFSDEQKDVVQAHKLTSYKLACGPYNYPTATTGIALGIEAATSANYAFTYNGDVSRWTLDHSNTYNDHGEGTFNVNLANGACDFYLGESSLCSIFQQKQDAFRTTGCMELTSDENGLALSLKYDSNTLSIGDDKLAVNASALFSTSNSFCNAANVNYTGRGESTDIQTKIQNIEDSISVANNNIEYALGTKA